MTEEERLERLTTVFNDLFEKDDIVLSPATTAADIPGWDSLGHIRLMLTVEKKFKVRFKSSEVSSLRNVGELIDLIAKKAP